MVWRFSTSIVAAAAQLSCGLLFVGCGGGGASSSPQSSLAEDASVFAGLSGVERQSDGSWLLSWSAISNSQAVYGIYMADSEEAMSYTEPFRSTKESSYRYKAENVLSEGKRCFAVRVLAAGDANKKVVCNTAEPSVFGGLGSLTVQADKSYLLRWQKLPVDDAVYWIFERLSSGSYNFQIPSYQQKSDFYKTSVNPRGVSKCYVVRVVHSNYGGDTNQTEFCTELEPEIEFGSNGQKPIVGASNNGTRLVTWTPSSTPDVVAYRVFLDNQCSRPATCNGGSSEVEASQCLLTNLQKTKYEICVIAVDSADRESDPIVSVPFNHE